jgi:hypothetical protein
VFHNNSAEIDNLKNKIKNLESQLSWFRESTNEEIYQYNKDDVFGQHVTLNGKVEAIAKHLGIEFTHDKSAVVQATKKKKEKK